MEAFNSEMFSFFSAMLPNNTFYIAQFEGTEALNSLFHFDLKLLCKDADIDTEALVGTKAVFTIHRKKGDDAVFPGYISQIEQSGSIHGYTYYDISISPSFARFKPLVGSAVFLDSDFREAIEQVIGREPFFFLDYEFRLAGTYPKKEFAMQYEEGSFEYILWRLEEEGAYFYFDKNSERVIFADNPMSHTQSEGTVYYSPITGLENSVIDEVITSFTLHQAMLPARVVVRTYHWQDPDKMLVGIAEVSANGTGDVYLSNEEAESQSEAERIAKIRAEQILSAGRIFKGNGYVPFLRPGTVFTLDRHPTEKFNRDYIVTKIKHEGRQETLLSMVLGIPIDDSETDHFFYRNSFECIESAVKYVSSRTANRAVIPGRIRAFIDGDQAGEPLMDKYGRYKVLFPFDVSGRSMGKASCWVRRAQEQVGKDFGVAFPLVPGTEVLVSFINGNPDWPVINGALANGETGSISTGANSHLCAIRTEGGPQITFNNKNNGIQLSNVTGSGIAMAAGSMGYMTTSTHIGLKTTATAFSDIGGFFGDFLTGFVYRRRAICTSLSQYLSLATVAAGKAGQKIYEGLSEKAADPNEPLQDWGATATKLIPLIAFLDPPPYNVRISASKKNSSVRIQCFPESSELVINIGIIILSRLLSITSETVDGCLNPYTVDTNADLTDYTKKLKEAMQAIYEVGAIKDYAKYRGQAEHNQQQELNAGEYFIGAESTPCMYYEQVKQAIEDSIHNLESYLDDAASEENRIAWTESINTLNKILPDLNSAYEKSCEKKEIKKNQVYDDNLKNNVRRNKFIGQALSLLPELGVIIAIYIWQSKIKRSEIGGIMIDAQDKNMNIHAKSYIGVHAERGIYLNTKNAKYERKNPDPDKDIGLWGAPSNRQGNREKADSKISKIFTTIQDLVTWKVKPNNSKMTVKEVINEGHTNLREPVTGGAAVDPANKENTFIAEDAELSYKSSKYTLHRTEDRLVVRSQSITFRMPEKQKMCFTMNNGEVKLSSKSKIMFCIQRQFGPKLTLDNLNFYCGMNTNSPQGIVGNEEGISLKQERGNNPSNIQLLHTEMTLSACTGEEESSLILKPETAQLTAKKTVLGNLLVEKNKFSAAKGGIITIENVLKVTEGKKLDDEGLKRVEKYLEDQKKKAEEALKKAMEEKRKQKKEQEEKLREEHIREFEERYNKMKQKDEEEIAEENNINNGE